MADFPNISPLYKVVEDSSLYDTIRSPFEAGYTHTRPRWTSERKRFKLEWQALTDADKNTLYHFFENVAKGGGQSFNFTDPSGSTVYTMVFADDRLRFTSTRKGYWKGSILLVEV
jgi:hypothetical protein